MGKHKPIVVLPWLQLDSVQNIGGVLFVNRNNLNARLPRLLAEQARRVLDSFVWVDGSRVAQSKGNLVGLVPRSRYVDIAGEEKYVSRLRDASTVLGAILAISDRSLPAEALNPYYIRIFPKDDSRSFAFPLANGELVGTDFTSFNIARAPWIGSRVRSIHIELQHYVTLLGQLIGRASRGSKRAARILTSLHWFVQSHTYALNITDWQNLVSIGTAFELLAKPEKDTGITSGLMSMVKEYTGRSSLEAFIGQFYGQQRSAVVHRGGSLTSVLPDGHVTYLYMTQDLYWFCLREHLYRIYKEPFPERAEEAQRLEWCLESNKSRLERLAHISPRNADRHDDFIDCLKGLHSCKRDTTGDPALCGKAMTKACRILAFALERRAVEPLPQPVIARMLACSEGLKRIAQNPDMVDPSTIAAFILGDQFGMGANVPIIHNLSLAHFLLDDHLLSGMANVFFERKSMIYR